MPPVRVFFAGTLSRKTLAVSLLGGMLALAPSMAHAQTDGGTNDASALPPVGDPYEENTSDAGTADASADASSGDASAEGNSEQEGSSLPEPRPRVLTEEQRQRLVPSDGELPSRDESAPHRFVLPPYMYEWGRRHHTRVVFPFYFENRVGDDFRLFIPPYYRLRTPTLRGDVFFPFVFHYEGGSNGRTFSTNVIPPFWHHRSVGPGRARSLAYGFFPLFSYAEAFDEQGRLDAEHLVIPPLLTYHRWWPTGQTTIAPFVVYVRNRATTDLAVWPFWFSHSSPEMSWRLIPPLLFFQRVNHEENRTLTVVGPFWSEGFAGGANVNLAPLFFHYHDRTTSRTTVPLLGFHTSSGPDRFSLITPLGGYAREGNERTLILPVYQQHRGITNWDAVAPFFYYGRTQRTGERTVQVLNFFHYRSPSSYAWGFLPFVARFSEPGHYDTIATPLFVHTRNEATRSSLTWVFPSFHAETSPQGRLFNFYPLFFSASGRTWHHNVFFPFVWDVGDSEQRRQVTVVAPFFARVSDRRSHFQWVFPNIFTWGGERDGQPYFGGDISPFVQWGSPRPGDSYWSILYGFVGHRRQGSFEQLRLLYIPITLSAPAPAPQRARNAPDEALLEL